MSLGITTLHSVCDVLNGFAFKSEEYVASGIRVVRITNVQKGRIQDDDPKFISADRAKEFSRFLLSEGDILISLTGNVGRVGVLTKAMLPAVLNQRVGALKVKSGKIDPRFLFHVLNSAAFERDAIKNSKGIAQLNLSSKWVEKYEIPRPRLEEQRRIAEVLDKADALRQKRRLALQKLDTLLQSVFLEMFGDLTKNPKGWDRVPVSEVAGITSELVDPTRPEYRKLFHYGSDRIEKDTGNLLPAKTAAEDGVTSVKFFFDDKAILYSKIRPNLNKVALATKPGLCSADVYPVNVNEALIKREFLWRVLLSNDFLMYAAGFSNRANIPKINREQFFGYRTILPPVELQNSFVEALQSITKLKEKVHRSLENSEDFFRSLQNRAFKGELFESPVPSVGFEPGNASLLSSPA